MSSIAGAPVLLRAELRHDGRGFAPWILIATALSASSVLVYPWIFPDVPDRLALSAAIGANPALGLIFGPAFDLTTTDGFNAWRSLALGGFLVALGAIFAVTKAVRGQEDSGQGELLASGVMGRSARLLAGVGLALVGSILAGVVAGIVTGLCGGDWQASMLLGATFTATGWMFAGIAAVASQLGQDGPTASSIAVGALGVLFVLRGFAYSLQGPDWTVWANPLGWMTETRPGTADDWWPLIYALGLTAVLLVVAFVLQSRREFGEGAIAPRPGPARGRMRTPLALAVRVNRGSLLTWAIAAVLLGVVFGYFARSISSVLESNDAVKQILASGAASQDDLISAFLVTILSLAGIILTIPGVQTMLKVRSEELNDRVEPVIAADVARPRYYGANVLVAFLAPALYLILTGAVVAGLAATADIGVDFGPVLLQAVATVPAVWTVIAVSVFVIGARPTVSIAAWLGVLASFVLTLLGPTFKLWDWVLAISPFWHVPDVSGSDPDWWGLLWISLVTILFLGVGFAGFRRRDLAR